MNSIKCVLSKVFLSLGYRCGGWMIITGSEAWLLQLDYIGLAADWVQGEGEGWVWQAGLLWSERCTNSIQLNSGFFFAGNAVFRGQGGAPGS
jgi:hypothetical protein